MFWIFTIAAAQKQTLGFLELFGFLLKSLIVPTLCNLRRKWKIAMLLNACIHLACEQCHCLQQDCAHEQGQEDWVCCLLLRSLILQVYCLPRSHQAVKAPFATLYDLYLSFIYSKCVCFYNLICCSPPPLPLGEV